MKASELITLLQEAVDKYGDLPLSSELSGTGDLIKSVKVTPIDATFNDEYETPLYLIMETRL